MEKSLAGSSTGQPLTCSVHIAELPVRAPEQPLAGIVRGFDADVVLWMERRYAPTRFVDNLVVAEQGKLEHDAAASLEQWHSRRPSLDERNNPSALTHASLVCHIAA